MFKSIFLILLPIIVLFTSCKKDSNDEETGTTFPENFQFVWQDEPSDNGDEIGMYFSETTISLWDYDGDAYDEGSDCYYVYEFAELVSFRGDLFTIKSIGFEDEGEDELEVKITVKGDSLYLSVFDEVTTMSKTDLTPSQLSPLCNDADLSETVDQKKLELLFRNEY